MNLILDSGNTRLKIYSASDQIIYDPAVFNHNETDNIIKYLNKLEIKNAISSNVAESLQAWEKVITDKTDTYIKLDKHTPIPIKNNYKTPETLGYDRLAAAVGSAALFPHQNILIIDFGTAITYDLIINNSFEGGAIAPGMQLRFKSLNQFTSRLPLLKPKEDYEIPGKTTEASILNGVIQGIKNEVEGTINSYSKEYSKLITVITGGDMEFFAKIIKIGIFAEPKLIAKGLNNILNYNVEKS
jgi:type III pantothenate kinase